MPLVTSLSIIKIVQGDDYEESEDKLWLETFMWFTTVENLRIEVHEERRPRQGLFWAIKVMDCIPNLQNVTFEGPRFGDRYTGLAATMTSTFSHLQHIIVKGGHGHHISPLFLSDIVSKACNTPHTPHLAVLES